jgi:CHAT domain-containing protein
MIRIGLVSGSTSELITSEARRTSNLAITKIEALRQAQIAMLRTESVYCRR